MKKILLLLCFFCSLFDVTGKSKSSKENDSRYLAIRRYYEQHVIPVLLEKRRTFDALLSESERNELNDCRLQIRQWRESIDKAIEESSEAVPERSTMMFKEEIRKEKHQHIKELIGRVHVIAKNHLSELDKIFLDLTVQRKKWVEDISKCLSADDEKPISFLNKVLNDDQGPLKMWSRAAFMLLEPSTAITPGDTKKLAAVDFLPASVNESFSIFPNPAINYVTLDMTNATAGYKLTISDMQGKTLLQKENFPGTEYIDCSGFPAGIYLVQLLKENEVINRKLIINR